MLVVLHRQLEKLYGPTLASCYQFLVGYHPTKQQKQGSTAVPANPSDVFDNTNTSLTTDEELHSPLHFCLSVKLLLLLKVHLGG